MQAIFKLVFVALIALSFAVPGPALAAGSDDGSSQTSSADLYTEAKGLVYKEKYAEARAMLVAITTAEPRNADAWNLLGFSARKLGDLRAAAAAYDRALALNPDHRGALEYQGEMFILMGQGDKAKANLVKLQGLCRNCDELRDLKMAMTAAGLS